MKIVVTNECFLTKEQTEKLKTLGEVTFYDSTNDFELVNRIKDADIVLGDCYLTKFDESVFSKCKKLKLLQINSTGYSGVDINVAKKFGILVSNVPGFATDSVAEIGITLMLTLGKNLILANKDFMNNYKNNPFEVEPGNKVHEKYLGKTFRHKTLGIVGLGEIGKRTAEIANGIGMNVIGWNRTKKDIKKIKFVELDYLFKESDAIIICLAYDLKLNNFIGKSLLSKMKNESILVNIGMPKLIDEEALIEILKERKIFAATDIPNLKNMKLISQDNYLAVPHIGWFTKESLDNIGEIIFENVSSFINDKPKNIVNF